MKTFLWTIVLFILVFPFNEAYTQKSWSNAIWSNDPIVAKIDSIISSIYNSNVLVATEYDASKPEGIYGYYLADTTTRQIRLATLFTYQGKIKKLTNYYFFENKLISIDEVNVPIDKQTSTKFRKLDRNVHYWNDTVRHVFQQGKVTFDYKADFQTAKEIIARFGKSYDAGKLVFNQKQ